MSRTEIERRTSLQGESYYSVRRSRIQSWSSGGFEPDDGDDTDQAIRLFDHTYSSNRTPLPFREPTYSSYEYPRAADSFEGSIDMRRERPRSGDVEQGLREIQEEIQEEIKRRRFEKVLQEDAEVKTAALNEPQAEAERPWRAESPEWPRAHLRGMYSFSELPNKDTISRDITIGNEAEMDDLLGSVGKRMIKYSFLKESRDETSNGGGGLEADAMESRIHLKTDQPAADRSRPSLNIMSLLNDD
ncbi:hypothetical protein FPCIR_8019 [Fusarium pseudocircinatum]|uniref:Uncharacterized protein n=1 Tax=Fusarium pseudocircinatum TaxID=56676 RepID=A0A8H5L746_9HYPO|nr:hypothetical protein FPCIR_8019 [Fusarium pseudocircinatum]